MMPPMRMLQAGALRVEKNYGGVWMLILSVVTDIKTLKRETK